VYVDGQVQSGAPWQAGLAEVAEPLVVAQPVVSIGKAQHARVEAIPAPGNAMRVQVADEGCLVVQGRHIRGRLSRLPAAPPHRA
jgi:hypothetical protein